MAGDRVQGLAEAYAMFGRVPDAARDELGVEIAIVSRDFLALQQIRAPERTGALRGELGIQLLLDQLRARVGLVGKQSKAKFYGRVIEFGRKAQTVLAKRRRALDGKLRTGKQRRRASDIAEFYSKNIGAIASQPFVHVPDPDVDRIALQRLSDFWAKTLHRAGGAA